MVPWWHLWYSAQCNMAEGPSPFDKYLSSALRFTTVKGSDLQPFFWYHLGYVYKVWAVGSLFYINFDVEMFWKILCPNKKRGFWNSQAPECYKLTSSKNLSWGKFRRHKQKIKWDDEEGRRQTWGRRGEGQNKIFKPMDPLVRHRYCNKTPWSVKEISSSPTRWGSILVIQAPVWGIRSTFLLYVVSVTRKNSKIKMLPLDEWFSEWNWRISGGLCIIQWAGSKCKGHSVLVGFVCFFLLSIFSTVD